MARKPAAKPAKPAARPAKPAAKPAAKAKTPAVKPAGAAGKAVPAAKAKSPARAARPEAKVKPAAKTKPPAKKPAAKAAPAAKPAPAKRKPGPLATALAWLRAVDARDRAAMMGLSARGIELLGPHGVSTGHETLGIWYNRVIMKVALRRAYVSGARVLILHKATWVSPFTGAIADEKETASIFDVKKGEVIRYNRDDDPTGVLKRHGFAAAHEKPLPAGGQA